MKMKVAEATGTVKKKMGWRERALFDRAARLDARMQKGLRERINDTFRARLNLPYPRPMCPMLWNK